MNWFLIAILPPALWAASNHFDKYLLSKYFKDGGIGALMIFSAIIGIILLPIIVIIKPEVLTFSASNTLIVINGIIYILAVLPYLYALNKDDASTCVPIFQLIPVISFILGFLVLGETLLRNQIIGGLIIIAGAFIISLDAKAQFKVKWDVLLLMILSSFLYASNFIFFKYFALDFNFWATSFWEYVGFGVAATVFFLIKPYRQQFIKVYKQNKLSVLGLNATNEVINIIAKIVFNFATLLAPVTLVWITNGFQPVFVFLYAIILTFLFPSIIQEGLNRKELVQKNISITIVLIGAYIINL